MKGSQMKLIPAIPRPLLSTSFQGLWNTTETVIERGFYCSYDPFTRLDVRCELCIPGGVVRMAGMTQISR